MRIGLKGAWRCLIEVDCAIRIRLSFASSAPRFVVATVTSQARSRPDVKPRNANTRPNEWVAAVTKNKKREEKAYQRQLAAAVEASATEEKAHAK